MCISVKRPVLEKTSMDKMNRMALSGVGDRLPFSGDSLQRQRRLSIRSGFPKILHILPIVVHGDELSSTLPENPPTPRRPGNRGYHEEHERHEDREPAGKLLRGGDGGGRMTAYWACTIRSSKLVDLTGCGNNH